MGGRWMDGSESEGTGEGGIRAGYRESTGSAPTLAPRSLGVWSVLGGGLAELWCRRRGCGLR